MTDYNIYDSLDQKVKKILQIGTDDKRRKTKRRYGNTYKKCIIYAQLYEERIPVLRKRAREYGLWQLYGRNAIRKGDKYKLIQMLYDNVYKDMNSPYKIGTSKLSARAERLKTQATGRSKGTGRRKATQPRKTTRPKRKKGASKKKGKKKSKKKKK